MPEGPATAGDAVETASRALLGRYPQAPIAAVNEFGVLVEMPESIGVAGHPIMTGRSTLDLVVPADRVAVISAWDSARTAGAARATVRPASRPDDQVRLHVFDLRPAHGMLLIVFVDDGQMDDPIDKTSEPALRPRLFRHRKNDIGVYIDVDDAVTDILGWEPRELVGRPSLDIMHPEDHQRAIEHWMEMLATPLSQRRVRLRHRHANGGWVWLELTSSNLLDHPDHECVEAEAVDISDEMAAHEGVRARERLLHRIAETMPLGLLHVDAERRVVYSNERLHQIVGRELEPTVDAQLSNVVQEDRHSLELALQDVLRNGRDVDLELRLRVPEEDGERSARLRFGALVDDEGHALGAVICVDDVTERARLYAELERRAEFDVLTECRSRASIMTALDDAMGKGPLAIVFLDLDGFKDVNDAHGHAMGDKLLVIVGERLRRAVRTGDLVGRLGGDEFLVVCSKADSTEEVIDAAARLADAVSRPVRIGATRISIRVSVGVTVASDGMTAERLIADADTAMYESKRQGAGRPVLYTPQLLAGLA
jgi:diguanylate cyclase (GGDEF)-like protein/PAS domain S-box-containing protein